jgi:hypothetical protein
MKLRRALVVPSLTVPDLESGFEGGSPLDIFDAPVATPPSQDAAATHTGSFGALFNPNLAFMFMRWRAAGGTQQSIPASSDCWSFRTYVRFPAATFPPSGIPPSIISVTQLTGSDDFTFFYNPTTNKWQWDLDNADLARSIDEVIPDHYYLIEGKGEYFANNWRADVRIDGVPQDSILTTGNAASTLQYIQFGTAVDTQVWTAHFDDMAFAYSTGSPLRFLGPKNA